MFEFKLKQPERSMLVIIYWSYITIGIIICVKLMLQKYNAQDMQVITAQDMQVILSQDIKVVPAQNIQAISKTGAWQNTKFTHLIDNKFGASLLLILKQYNISSITDLGCGTGAYIRMIEDNKIKTQGFDGNPETNKWDVSGGLCKGPVDITQKKFWEVTDAAMSIEVAEHIPAEYEGAFINNLVSSARHMIFLSWGVPGQGGEGHVNGKWGEDVVQIMSQKGWKKNEILTRVLQIEAEFDWLKKNVQVFDK